MEEQVTSRPQFERNFRTISSVVGKQGIELIPTTNNKSGFYWRSKDGKHGGNVSEKVAQEYLATPKEQQGSLAKGWQIQENQYLAMDPMHPGQMKVAMAFMLVKKAAEVEAVATFEEFD